MDWWEGPTNAIDRLIVIYGWSAREVSWELEVPLWLCVERFNLHHSQRLAPLAA